MNNPFNTGADPEKFQEGGNPKFIRTNSYFTII